MSELSTTMAKLAGIRKAAIDAMNEKVGRGSLIRPREHFSPHNVGHYFTQAASLAETLKKLLPNLYGDFQAIETEPQVEMATEPKTFSYAHVQIERLVRDIDQIFEIRANSELEQPKNDEAKRRVFISHGQSDDWRHVQPFIDKDVGLATLELAQEPNQGRTVIEKLNDYASRCDSAVIVMTGDDVAGNDEARVRENVMHETGFFQGRYGRNYVILLHEEGVNIPTNLAGVVYAPFPKGHIEAAFHVLQRELTAIYKL